MVGRQSLGCHWRNTVVLYCVVNKGSTLQVKCTSQKLGCDFQVQYYIYVVPHGLVIVDAGA